MRYLQWAIYPVCLPTDAQRDAGLPIHQHKPGSPDTAAKADSSCQKRSTGLFVSILLKILTASEESIC